MRGTEKRSFSLVGPGCCVDVLYNWSVSWRREPLLLVRVAAERSSLISPICGVDHPLQYSPKVRQSFVFRVVGPLSWVLAPLFCIFLSKAE